MQNDERAARAEALRMWALRHLPGVDPATQLARVSDDASFRRYFRLAVAAGSVVLVDAPPELEDSQPFVAVGKTLLDAGLRAPQQLHVDLDQGFMMLEDFGNTLLLDQASARDAQLPAVYARATQGLVDLAGIDVAGLPLYDEDLLRREMGLFQEWLCERQLGLRLDAAEQDLLEGVMAFLTEAALAQPAIFVHRDYHSRNLMVVDDGPLGLIDFQDAVCGPVTYDLVSLLKDCYIRLPREFVESAAAGFRGALKGSLPGLPDDETFLNWMDLMGLQRHIKCAGIFSRLNLRDGKPAYLGDIPLVFSYIREAAGRFSELAPFDAWLDARLAPAIARLGSPRG